MKKITSMLMLFLMLLGTGSVKAEIMYEDVATSNLSTLRAGDIVVLLADNSTRCMIPAGNLLTAPKATPAEANYWTLEASATANQFYLYNAANKKYVSPVGDWNTQVSVTADKNAAGIYVFGDNSGQVNIKCCNYTGNNGEAAKVHLTWQSGGDKVVRFGPAASKWAIKKVIIPVPTGDYPSAVAEGVAYTKPNGRRLEGVTLTVNGKAQTHMLTAPLTVYTKALNRHFVVKPGDEVTPTFNYFIEANNPWMHGYVFVDFGQDGQFSSSVTSSGVPEANSDLKSFSYYNNKDSEGAAAEQGGKPKSEVGNTIPCPAFSIPAETAPGVYYMRYMVDWNNIDAKSTGNTGNPMAICDIALYVVGAEGNVTVGNQDLGTVTAVSGQPLAEKAATNKDFQFKINAKNAGDILGASVRHGFNLTGEQVVKGLTQYQIDQFLANGEGIITIPAAYMDGDIQITPVKTDEVLIFADEFNGVNGSQPNPVWKRSPRWGSVWNRLVSKKNDVIYLQDGNLVCRAIKNVDPLPGEETPEGTTNMRTGAVETSGANGFNFRYGRVECRAKANPFQGTFPAIWMMPADGTGGWPSCGEIDIFEAVNTEAKAHHTVHTNWTYNAPKHPATHNEAVNFDDYHVYGLEWDDKSLKFYLDGNLQWTYTKDTSADAIKRRQWPFNRNFYLILNQSVGRGNEWAKEPNPDHIYEFLVDWIRVYQNPHHAAECELRAKIEEFEERRTHKVDDFREGTKVCEYTFDNEALAAAKIVLEGAANKTTDELKAALKSLDNLYVLNQPKKNHFYRMRCADNNMRYVQSTVNGNGKLDLKKSGAEENGDGVAATFLYTDKGLVSYVNGQYCGGESLKAVGENAVAHFGNVRNGRLGAYTIQLGADANNSLKGDGTTLAVKYPTNDLNNNSSNWWLEQVNELQITFNADATAAYATIYAPVALQCPVGITAYTGVKVDNTLKLTQIENGIIPAGTGVLLKGAKEKAGVQKFKILYDNQENTVSNNDFIGICASENGVEGKNYYVLGKGSVHTDIIGFYTHTGAANKVVKGFRARLAKESTPAAANVLRMVFDDEVTGIEGVVEEVNANAVIYDLSGRRVAVPTKGLYIINGKKVYVK